MKDIKSVTIKRVLWQLLLLFISCCCLGDKQVSANKFFGRQLIDLCTVNEPAKHCLERILDQIATVEQEIEAFRNKIGQNMTLLGFERPLIELNQRLDRLAGLESMATYVLREGCTNESQLENWPEEQTCVDDANHVPRYDQSLMQIYLDNLQESLMNDKLMLSQEEKVGRAIVLLSKLQSEISRQTEHREDIKAGFWINKRYAEREISGRHTSSGQYQDS